MTSCLYNTLPYFLAFALAGAAVFLATAFAAGLAVFFAPMSFRLALGLNLPLVLAAILISLPVEGLRPVRKAFLQPVTTSHHSEMLELKNRRSIYV